MHRFGVYKIYVLWYTNQIVYIDTCVGMEEMDMAVIEITQENYEAEVLHSDKPVLLDFWAAWCGPCQMLSPVVDKIGEEHEDIKVGKINVDTEGELASQFRVMSIPTLIVMKDGEESNRSVGVVSQEEILALL